MLTTAVSSNMLGKKLEEIERNFNVVTDMLWGKKERDRVGEIKNESRPQGAGMAFELNSGE